MTRPTTRHLDFAFSAAIIATLDDADVAVILGAEVDPTAETRVARRSDVVDVDPRDVAALLDAVSAPMVDDDGDGEVWAD